MHLIKLCSSCRLTFLGRKHLGAQLQVAPVMAHTYSPGGLHRALVSSAALGLTTLCTHKPRPQQHPRPRSTSLRGEPSGHPTADLCNASLSSAELFNLWCFHSAHSVLFPTKPTERGKSSIFWLVFPLQIYWAHTTEHFLGQIVHLDCFAKCLQQLSSKKNKNNLKKNLFISTEIS